MHYTLKNFYLLFVVVIGSCAAHDTIQWSGQHYDKYSSPQFNAGSTVVAHFISEFPLIGNEKILDVGCATGNLVRTLANKVPGGFVIGIDISSDMINCAKRKYQDVENIEFQTCPAQELDKIGQDEFDLVTCLACLHFIKLDEQFKALSNMYACLKNGGKLLMTTVSKSRPFVFKDAVLTTVVEQEWCQYLCNAPNLLYIRTKEEMESLLKQIGFSAIVYETEHVYTFETREEFFNWLYGWLVGFSLFIEIPEDKRKEFLNATIDTYLTNLDWQQGTKVTYTVPILKVIAEKI